MFSSFIKSHACWLSFNPVSIIYFCFYTFLLASTARRILYLSKTSTSVNVFVMSKLRSVVNITFKYDITIP